MQSVYYTPTPAGSYTQPLPDHGHEYLRTAFGIELLPAAADTLGNRLEQRFGPFHDWLTSALLSIREHKA